MCRRLDHDAHPRPRECIKVAAGGSHACALLGDGTMRCWGKNSTGQIRESTPTKSLEELGHGLDVSAGMTHTCAVVDDGFVDCWGNNQFGQGTGTGMPLPIDVPITLWPLDKGSRLDP